MSHYDEISKFYPHMSRGSTATVMIKVNATFSGFTINSQNQVYFSFLFELYVLLYVFNPHPIFVTGREHAGE